jgi:hypothetical protein
MFRRIELIHELPAQAGELPLRMKSGIMGWGKVEVFDAWAKMNNPRRDVHRNSRFYFTEAGWRKYGRATVAACQFHGQGYRVLRIKESAVDVIYRDEWQVAVRPKRKRH